jgi:anti-sigma regulatory factor (Ser/Thr protein kinase)
MAASQHAEPRHAMREHLPATLASVGVARRAVRSFAAGLDVDVEGLALAVSEAVANVVAHAYAEGSRGTLELSAAASPFDVTVTVRDEGHGLDGGTGTGGAGFGLLIIARLAQRVELADTPRGVALTMSFARGGGWSAR